MLKHETRSLARAMKVSRNVFKNSITICVARYFFFFLPSMSGNVVGESRGIKAEPAPFNVRFAEISFYLYPRPYPCSIITETILPRRASNRRYRIWSARKRKISCFAILPFSIDETRGLFFKRRYLWKSFISVVKIETVILWWKVVNGFNYTIDRGFNFGIRLPIR